MPPSSIFQSEESLLVFLVDIQAGLREKIEIDKNCEFDAFLDVLTSKTADLSQSITGVNHNSLPRRGYTLADGPWWYRIAKFDGSYVPESVNTSGTEAQHHWWLLNNVADFERLHAELAREPRTSVIEIQHDLQRAPSEYGLVQSGVPKRNGSSGQDPLDQNVPASEHTPAIESLPTVCATTSQMEGHSIPAQYTTASQPQPESWSLSGESQPYMTSTLPPNFAHVHNFPSSSLNDSEQSLQATAEYVAREANVRRPTIVNSSSISEASQSEISSFPTPINYTESDAPWGSRPGAFTAFVHDENLPQMWRPMGTPYDSVGYGLPDPFTALPQGGAPSHGVSNVHYREHPVNIPSFQNLSQGHSRSRGGANTGSEGYSIDTQAAVHPAQHRISNLRDGRAPYQRVRGGNSPHQSVTRPQDHARNINDRWMRRHQSRPRQGSPRGLGAPNFGDRGLPALGGNSSHAGSHVRHVPQAAQEKIIHPLYTSSTRGTGHYQDTGLTPSAINMPGVNTDIMTESEILSFKHQRLPREPEYVTPAPTVGARSHNNSPILSDMYMSSAKTLSNTTSTALYPVSASLQQKTFADNLITDSSNDSLQQSKNIYGNPSMTQIAAHQDTRYPSPLSQVAAPPPMATLPEGPAFLEAQDINPRYHTVISRTGPYDEPVEDAFGQTALDVTLSDPYLTGISSMMDNRGLFRTKDDPDTITVYIPEPIQFGSAPHVLPLSLNSPLHDEKMAKMNARRAATREENRKRAKIEAERLHAEKEEAREKQARDRAARAQRRESVAVRETTG